MNINKSVLQCERNVCGSNYITAKDGCPLPYIIPSCKVHDITCRPGPATCRRQVSSMTQCSRPCMCYYNSLLLAAALVGMLHVGVFILLLLSGERNFGVRLNKPYVYKIALPDIPKFSGTHADLLFLVCVTPLLQCH